MTDLTDRPGSVRDEDAFDASAVHSWLADRVPGLGDAPPAVRQFPGGASNLTYLLSYPGRDVILRRPPTGHKAASAHDMGREVRVQQGLKPVYDYVPEILAYCQDESVIGSDFYVMERIEGIILRQDPPAGMVIAPDQARALCLEAFDALIDLHQVDPVATGLDSLGKGPGYVARQVSGWSRRLEGSRTDDLGDFSAVMAWLDANQPQDVAQRLIHGDFRLDNVVLDGADTLNVVGVLDWEMATVGDPMMDLGCALSYWIQADDDDFFRAARRQPSDLPGMPTRHEIVGMYCERMGFDASRWPFYEVFGLFRLAVILQQIYYRYHHGQTHNPAFENFGAMANYLGARCKSVAGLD